MIKPLEDMTIGQRIALTFVIALIILLALAIAGWISGGWDETPAAPLEASKYDEHLVSLDKRALENAYHDQLVKLWAVWLRDETDQPRRMKVGIAQARRAYIEAMTEIEKREGKQ